MLCGAKIWWFSQTPQVLESLCGADRKAVVELHQVLQAEVHTREAWTQGSVQRVAYHDARVTCGGILWGQRMLDNCTSMASQ